MPTVMNMVLQSIPLEGVIGKAYRPSVRLRVSDKLDGSSLDMDRNEHLVVFVLGSDLLPAVKPVLKLNDTADFSARYSTGEVLSQVSVLVRTVEPLDSGDVQYTLLVSPNSAVLHEPAPG